MTRRLGLQSVITSYSLRISLVLAFAIFTVVVFDFVGPNAQINALGQKIAVGFREALSKMCLLSGGDIF